MRRTTAFIAIALMLAACGSAEEEDPADSPVQEMSTTEVSTTEVAVDIAASSGCSAPASATVETVVLNVGEEQRSYDLYVPDSVEGPVPVVLSYHGFGPNQSSQAQAELSRLESAADEGGFIAVFPQGTVSEDGGPPYFNFETLDDPALADDIEFTEAILDSIEAKFCVDRTQVFAMGWSNGGLFSATLACRLGDRIAAVAPVAAVLMLEDCGERSVPILITHGTADPLIPFDEAEPSKVSDSALGVGATDLQGEMFGGVVLPVTEYVEVWASHNGCDTDPVSSDVGTEITVVEYSGCDSGADVVFQIVEGGGHAWPGTPFPERRAANLGYATLEIDATAEALAFFWEHPLPLEYLQS